MPARGNQDGKENKDESHSNKIKASNLINDIVKLRRDHQRGNNFLKWKEQLETIAYYLEWPQHLFDLNGQDWDGQEEKGEVGRQRKEAFFLLRRSIPLDGDYDFFWSEVQPGDTLKVWKSVHHWFMRKDPANVGQLRKRFYHLTMKNSGLDVARFAARIAALRKQIIGLGENCHTSEQRTACSFKGYRHISVK